MKSSDKRKEELSKQIVVTRSTAEKERVQFNRRYKKSADKLEEMRNLNRELEERNKQLILKVKKVESGSNHNNEMMIKYSKKIEEFNQKVHLISTERDRLKMEVLSHTNMLSKRLELINTKESQISKLNSEISVKSFTPNLDIFS